MINNISDNEKAVSILKNKGEQTIKEIANELEVTTEGARFQLLKLSNEGLVKSESRSKGRGRPQQVWSLTAKGHTRFPDRHPRLTVKLIEKIKQNLGEDVLNKIIYSAGEDNILRYKEKINSGDSLEEKIKKLAEIRTSEGYMARYEKDDKDSSFMLIENHCPICEAAKTCQGFCKSELNTFKTVLGENIQIKRVNHILEGARRCAYKIEEKKLEVKTSI